MHARRYVPRALVIARLQTVYSGTRIARRLILPEFSIIVTSPDFPRLQRELESIPARGKNREGFRKESARSDRDGSSGRIRFPRSILVPADIQLLR